MNHRSRNHPRMAVLGVSLALASAGLFAQTAPQAPAAAPAAAPKTAAVSNSSAPAGAGGFPTKEEAKKNWHANDPAPKGPYITPAGAGGSSAGANSVNAQGLPNPNIDYADIAKKRMFPLTPAQVRDFGEHAHDQSKAASAAPGGPYISLPPRMVKVSIDPGKALETVTIAMGKGAIASFIDRNGQPMIVDAVEGFSPAISVRVMKTERAVKEGSNTFSVDALSITGQGRVVVHLNGVTTPYAFDVEVGHSNRVDSVVSFVMPMSSSKKVVYGAERGEADASFDKPEMWGFLSGVVPDRAVEVELPTIPGSRAFVLGNFLYVRTPHKVMTPAYFDRRASSDGGTVVYQLPLTSIIRMGVEGREMQALVNYPYMPSATRSSK